MRVRRSLQVFVTNKHVTKNVVCRPEDELIEGGAKIKMEKKIPSIKTKSFNIFSQLYFFIIMLAKNAAKISKTQQNTVLK